MILRSLLASTVLTVLAGCSSLSSTYVGETAASSKFEGMPIVVQRPKYLKVVFKKVTYRLLVDRTAQRGNDTTSEVLQMGTDIVVNEVSTEVLSVGEVYALDLKRPLSGTTEYAVEFDPNAQYPKKVGAKIDDQSVAALADALKKVGETTFKAASAGATPKGDLIRVAEDIVRIELRSLSDPNVVTVIRP
ncbi:hypothetical protein LJR175_007629 [Variovorax sp. LjRoot175]|uniref:hypothetical protein n=1 Tax=Variovorax sp. LjRoot175 TaxID=3342276 RepID=UPI003ECC3E3C